MGQKDTGYRIRIRNTGGRVWKVQTSDMLCRSSSAFAPESRCRINILLPVSAPINLPHTGRTGFDYRTAVKTDTDPNQNMDMKPNFFAF